MNRLIITDKGVQVSKEIHNDIINSQQQHHHHQHSGSSPKKSSLFGNHNNNSSVISAIRPFEKQSAQLSTANFPSGYHAQLQSKISVSLMQSPFRSTYCGTTSVINNNNSANLQHLTQQNNQSSHLILRSIQSSADLHSGGVLQDLYPKSQQHSLQQHQMGDSLFLRGGVYSGRSTQLQGGSALPSARSSSYNNGSSTNNNNMNNISLLGQSTFVAVNNRKALEGRVAVDSLGGLKLSMANLNYKNELEQQNVQQKLQIQSVQQERMTKKHADWNESYQKQKQLMRDKYEQKQAELTKLGDKEDEQVFWQQWQTLKQSCDQCLDAAEKQNARYEERVIRKLNKKYRSSFKNLPACAKLPSTHQQRVAQLPVLAQRS